MSLDEPSFFGVFSPDTGDVRSLAREIEEWAKQHNVSEKTAFSVNLILEEMITNIVKYGYRDQTLRPVELRLEVVEKNIKLIVRDFGAPFNLLQMPDPDFTQDLNSRAVGGLGLYLIRQLADAIDYRRDGDANEVIFRKVDP